ncbi:hypothetical protein [Chryseobacterium sp.]|uniref:hypothetical protein n=1 Tax=Chryseobacterium sp. TaxID=1871047 RepID=UPI0011C8F8E1|nr:hypothetical protein [Chryseobacterium sp.]TXF77321.1 hypothetical protein FUA25_05150 [Chryseobacterium sp.]
MFDFFKKSRNVEGLIKFYKLENWWFDTFNDFQRNRIANSYKTFGTVHLSQPLIKGKQIDSRPDFIFLLNLSQFFNTKADFDLSFPMIKEAEQRFNEDVEVLELHFYFGEILSFYYKLRDNAEFYEKAKIYALKQIDLSNKSKNAFLHEKYGTLPMHLGYKQLCIILEKEKKISEAIEIAEKAKKEGWDGDWDKRIEKLKKIL